MYGLIVDTTTKYLYIALYKDQVLLEEKLECVNKSASDLLFTLLDDLLLCFNLKLKDIKEVIVGVGPGSFTGARISITFAKMLSFAGVKLKCISSLALLAGGHKGDVISFLDARNGNCYYEVLGVTKPDFAKLSDLKEQYPNHTFITDSDFKVSLPRVFEFAYEVLNPDLLEPNYIRNGKVQN